MRLWYSVSEARADMVRRGRDHAARCKDRVRGDRLGDLVHVDEKVEVVGKIRESEKADRLAASGLHQPGVPIRVPSRIVRGEDDRIARDGIRELDADVLRLPVRVALARHGSGGVGGACDRNRHRKEKLRNAPLHGRVLVRAWPGL
jgi:hypothetical protein